MERKFQSKCKVAFFHQLLADLFSHSQIHRMLRVLCRGHCPERGRKPKPADLALRLEGWTYTSNIELKQHGSFVWFLMPDM